MGRFHRHDDGTEHDHDHVNERDHEHDHPQESNGAHDEHLGDHSGYRTGRERIDVHDADTMADAVTRVAEGDAVFSPRLAGFVLDAFGRGPSTGHDPELDQLTARERDALRLIARGYTYKEIARELTISVKTVESHVSAVLRKLQLSNRHELTKWASERKLL